jgi:hypothetical protein
MVTEAEVRKALRKVKDPELNLDLVVLGLIYDLKIDGGRVDVTMSLTSPMCPVAGELLEKAREAVETVPGVDSRSHQPHDPRRAGTVGERVQGSSAQVQGSAQPDLNLGTWHLILKKGSRPGRDGSPSLPRGLDGYCTVTEPVIPIIVCGTHT